MTRRLVGEGIWVVLGQIFAVLASLVTVKILSTILGPDGYGLLAVGITIAILPSQICFGPLSNGAMRFLPNAIQGNASRPYLTAISRLTIKGSVITILLAAPIVLLTSISTLGNWSLLVLLAALFSIASGWQIVSSALLNAARLRKLYALQHAGAAWLKVLLAVVVCSLVAASAESALLGYTVAVGVIAMSQQLFVQRAVPQSASAPVEAEVSAWERKVTEFTLPFSKWGVFTWAQQGSDRWVLVLFFGASDVGIYAVAYQLGYFPMMLCGTMIAQFASPIFYGWHSDGKDSGMVQRASQVNWYLSGLVLLVTVIFSICAYFLADFFVSLFAAPEFHSSASILPYLVLAGGIFSASQTLGISVLTRMETRRLTRMKIITAVAGLTLNFLIGMRWGAPGVAIAMVLTALIHAFWTLIIVMRFESAPQPADGVN